MANPSISLWGATYSAVPGVTLPTSGGGEATFQWVEGSQTISENGIYDVTALEEVVVNVSGGGTPAISVVDTTDTAGGTIRTITALDISDTTAVASDVAQGKYFYTAAGVKTAGTGSGGGGGGLTQHEIHLEFTDSTDTDIEVDYDDSVLGEIITSYAPALWTYNNKTVISAALDGTVWFTFVPIPLNTQLVNYATCVSGYAIGENAEAFEQEWSYATDYIAINPTMTFNYRAYYWFHIGFYDEAHNPISALYVVNDATSTDPNDSNTGLGTLDGSKIPSNARYVRLCGQAAESAYISLIRTA